MRKIVVLLICALMFVGCGSSEEGEENTDTLVVGIIQLADHPSLDATVTGMKDELDKLVKESGKTVEYKFQSANGDMVKVDSIIQSYISEDVDLIYAVATNAAQSAMNLTKDTDIPVVFNAVTDPVAAGIVESMKNSNNHVTGVSDISPVDKQVAVIKEILPDAKKIGILYNVGEINSTVQIEEVQRVAKGLDLEVVTKGVASEADLSIAAEQISGEVDVIYNITDNMIVAATPLIVDIATKHKVPVLATEDGQLEQGILAAESLSYYELGVEAGKIINDILINGKKPSDIEVVVSDKTSLYINDEMVEKLGLTIPEDVLSRRAN